MKTVTDDHDGGDAEQQRWMQWRRIYGTSTEEMWDDGDGEMVWNDSDRLGKY